MRGIVKKLIQFPWEFQRHKRVERFRGYIKEQGGGSYGNGDQAEGRRRFHLGD